MLWPPAEALTGFELSAPGNPFAIITSSLIDV